MQQPSENWKRLRHAVLDRAHRTAIEPFSPVYNVYVAVCAVYLAGFAHFNLFADGAELNLFSASLLIAAAFSGALVPLLTGAVVTLHLTSRRLQHLVNT
ncbi:hypothetical protein [Sulfitobacter pacificus]|uniref:Uncharacterized protein n=1 Tax=Sulfitobacter pacificus TaxID=1499314 RepID=A0ABQ5VMC1_9RHOB|nr:hypothetical protein [Sulfitobacter pacificus]GLQ28072.1 hypothetical protein GCM10007927_28750 [Sulfitobacter pacificus]